MAFLSINSFAFQNEPDGFRGIKWKTDVSTLKGMQHIRTEDGSAGIEVYKKEGDILKIGDTILETIEYAFWQGKLMGVRVTVDGYSNWEALKETYSKEYGEPSKPDQPVEAYGWLGVKTDIELLYNDSAKKGVLFILSKELNEQIQQYNKDNGNKGVEKGP